MQNANIQNDLVCVGNVNSQQINIDHIPAQHSGRHTEFDVLHSIMSPAATTIGAEAIQP